VLEVDPETGAIDMLRWIVAHDCGHVLEPGSSRVRSTAASCRACRTRLNVQLAYDEGGSVSPRR
jgi:CO/xanthine dehydrogenase Mo-binding subunit